jgi:hypothetical protein
MSPGRFAPASVSLALVICALSSGCAAAPSVVVLGASFPDWLFCITAGVIATALVHLVLARGRRLAWLAPPGVTYPALTAAFAGVAWLVFFRR